MTYQPYPTGGGSNQMASGERPPQPATVRIAVRLMLAGAGLALLSAVITLVLSSKIKDAVTKAAQKANLTNAHAGKATLTAAQIHSLANITVVLLVVLGIIGVLGLATAGAIWLAGRWSMGRSATTVTAGSPAVDGAPVAPAGVRSFVARPSRFRSYFLPVAYGLIPVVGADFLARQLPKFFKHGLRVVPAIGSWFGAGSTHSSLYHTQILGDPQIVIAQVVVVGLGMAASLWAMARITARDVASDAVHPVGARVAAMALVVACAVSAGFLYVIMHAAS